MSWALFPSERFALDKHCIITNPHHKSNNVDKQGPRYAVICIIEDDGVVGVVACLAVGCRLVLSGRGEGLTPFRHDWSASVSSH